MSGATARPSRRAGSCSTPTKTSCTAATAALAITPGNAASSRLVAMIEGRAKKKMPPKGELRPDEIATLRAWIDAGARYSEMPPPALDDKVPALAQQGAPAAAGHRRSPFAPTAVNSPLAAIARSVGARRPAERPAHPCPACTISCAPSHTALTVPGWRPRAACPGRSVRSPSSTPARACCAAPCTATATTSTSWRSAMTASASRAAATTRASGSGTSRRGRVLSVLREHTDAVFAVAFSPDDKWIASGAGDRSVKIWDAQKGVRLYTLDRRDRGGDDAAVPARRRAAAHGRRQRQDDPHVGARRGAGASRCNRSSPTPPRCSPCAIRPTAPARLRGSGPDGQDLERRHVDRGPHARAAERLAAGARLEPGRPLLAVGRYDGTVSALRHRDRQAHRRPDSTGCRRRGYAARPPAVRAQCTRRQFTTRLQFTNDEGTSRTRSQGIRMTGLTAALAGWRSLVASGVRPRSRKFARR